MVFTFRAHEDQVDLRVFLFVSFLFCPGLKRPCALSQWHRTVCEVNFTDWALKSSHDPLTHHTPLPLLILPFRENCLSEVWCGWLCCCCGNARRVVDCTLWNNSDVSFPIHTDCQDHWAATMDLYICRSMAATTPLNFHPLHHPHPLRNHPAPTPR